MNNFLDNLRKEGIPVKDDGLCICPKCGGDGVFETELYDWTSAIKCQFCQGKGKIAPKVYRKYFLTD